MVLVQVKKIKSEGKEVLQEEGYDSGRPKIYKPQSDSESEQELAEQEENAIFSQIKEEDKTESF